MIVANEAKPFLLVLANVFEFRIGVGIDMVLVLFLSR